MNYYEVLGVPEDATDDAIKRAWREKIQTVHPDHVSGYNTDETVKTEANKWTRRYNEAKETLLDEKARSNHDAVLRSQRPQEERRSETWVPPKHRAPDPDDELRAATASFKAAWEEANASSLTPALAGWRRSASYGTQVPRYGSAGSGVWGRILGSILLFAAPFLFMKGFVLTHPHVNTNQLGGQQELLTFICGVWFFANFYFIYKIWETW